jgi:short-subunit dehydrogenase
VTAPARGTALITGASAGIGAAFAHLLAAEGFDLVLVARRVDRLVAISAEVEERWGRAVRVFGTDLSDPSAPAGLEQHLAAEGVEIDVLINNAGFALKSSFAASSWREHAGFIEVMATSVAGLCHRFLPGMKERGWGRIINVSSIAAFTPEASGSLYGAVKMFTLSLSRALAKELEGTGVHVLALCPGYTLTEFHDVIGVRDQIDRLPGFMVMDAPTVARQGWEAVERGRVVYVNGRLNRLLVRVTRIVPHSWLGAIARRCVLRPDR